ncbi:makorin, ring finger protein, 4 [Trichomycterus rosablanca]|uniref:makorin, ring finger protein, 4 n=1 Tax=Trichomycterus rosablanca TaxID=2290929 RepID=UPI002F3574DB
MDGRLAPRRHQRKRDFNFERQICRQFINGSCRLGQHCFYLHEWPSVTSAQVCRYFQKGGCWYGENCRYLHIPSDGGASGARRGSAPVVHSSALTAHGSGSRRGSEPSLFLPQGAHSSRRRGSEPLVRRQNTLPPLTANIVEEEEYAVLEGETLSHLQGERRPHQSKGSSVTKKSHGLATTSETQQVCSLQDVPVGGASAVGGQSEAYNRSKDVLCGICMDKVYEKSTARERRFGILPNCSHAFCLGCIMTWRKTKEFQEDVIKACPQCRVKSTFYIPSKYWVSDGDAKAVLIASFKEKNSKVKCNYFLSYGCCPFASECIFSHEMPPGHRPQRRRFRPKSAVELLESMDSEEQRLLSYFIALTLLDDEDFNFLEEYELL